jgi:large subunit ribosomal protein L25
MIEGILRDSIAKQNTKQLRRDGYLIANIYGKNIKNINTAFKTNEFIKAMKNKTSLAFEVKVEATTYKVVIQEYQRDPLTSQLLHVDLMVVIPKLIANFKVPVKVVGEAKGVKNGGLLLTHIKRIPIQCTIEDLPNDFSFEVDNLDVGDNILIRDLKMSDKIKCFLDGRVAVVGVVKAK